MFKKKQSLDVIAKHSGNLAGKLSRLDPDKNYSNKNCAEINYTVVANAFELSIQNGGLKELDFIRVEDQNFNPRPARVAIILIESGVTLSSDLLAAACIASAESESTCFDAFPEAKALSQKALRTIENSALDDSTSTTLALALHLDRARHFHLSAKSNNEQDRRLFLEHTRKLITLAENNNVYLFNHLSHWLKRHTRKNFSR